MLNMRKNPRSYPHDYPNIATATRLEADREVYNDNTVKHTTRPAILSNPTEILEALHNHKGSRPATVTIIDAYFNQKAKPLTEEVLAEQARKRILTVTPSTNFRSTLNTSLSPFSRKLTSRPIGFTIGNVFHQTHVVDCPDIHLHNQQRAGLNNYNVSHNVRSYLQNWKYTEALIVAGIPLPDSLLTSHYGTKYFPRQKVLARADPIAKRLALEKERGLAPDGKVWDDEFKCWVVKGKEEKREFVDRRTDEEKIMARMLATKRSAAFAARHQGRFGRDMPADQPRQREFPVAKQTVEATNFVKEFEFAGEG